MWSPGGFSESAQHGPRHRVRRLECSDGNAAGGCHGEARAGGLVAEAGGRICMTIIGLPQPGQANGLVQAWPGVSSSFVAGFERSSFKHRSGIPGARPAP